MDIKKEKEKNTVTISRKDFISKPFTPCPNCQQNTFGVFILPGGGDSYDKECYECGYTDSFQLPKIKKRVIYLDQFVIDNIVKSLQTKHPKHDAAIKQPFWLEVFKRLEVASRAQLIVCPDSFFHREESEPTEYFESMQRIYEHFSGGVTFHNYNQIMEAQVCEHFEYYIKGVQTQFLPNFDPQDIVYDELHKWHGRIMISVRGKSRPELIERGLKSKNETYQSFLKVFNRWQTEQGKEFDEWYSEETRGFAKGTVQAIQNYFQSERELPGKIAHGYKLDIGDVFPPSGLELIQAMQRISRKCGLVDEREILQKILHYLFSTELNNISIIRIESLLYAILADQASKGRLKPPSPGVMTDVKMISSLLPYCEAIFLDKENAGLLMDGRVKAKLGHKTKIYSLRNKEDFLSYLDQIINQADPQHLAFVEQAYGTDWRKPYMRILDH